MFELKILFYNVLIFCILIAGMYVYLKWQKKKRIEKMLNKMEASYLALFNTVSSPEIITSRTNKNAASPLSLSIIATAWVNNGG